MITIFEFLTMKLLPEPMLNFKVCGAPWAPIEPPAPWKLFCYCCWLLLYLDTNEADESRLGCSFFPTAGDCWLHAIEQLAAARSRPCCLRYCLCSALIHPYNGTFRLRHVIAVGLLDRRRIDNHEEFEVKEIILFSIYLIPLLLLPALPTDDNLVPYIVVRERRSAAILNCLSAPRKVMKLARKRIISKA